MQAFPHCYKVTANAEQEGDVCLASVDKPGLESAPPVEFGGPGDLWSPEDLMLAAVVDCFVLSFRAIAKMSNLAWDTVECKGEGTLDRVDKVMQFTGFHLVVTLKIKSEADAEKARQLIQKAEAICPISNSLKADVHLEAEILSG